MKKLSLLLLTVVSFTALHAQDQQSVAKNQFKINILTPGFAFEHGFDSKNTLYSELSIGIGYRYSSGYGGTTYFVPILREEFRHYYNLEKRAAKDKVTSHNSGGYVGLHSAYYFESINTNKQYGPTVPSLVVGPVWGFQRTYKRKFNLGLNLGVGYDFDNISSDVVPIANFSLGWVLGQ
jgi:hypothetical protein